MSVAPAAVALAACSNGAQDAADSKAAAEEGSPSSSTMRAAAPVVQAAFVHSEAAPAAAAVSAPFRAHSRARAADASVLPQCTPLSSAGNDSCSDRTTRAVDSHHHVGQLAVAGRGLLSIPGKGVQVEDIVPGLASPLLVLHADIPSDAVGTLSGGTATYQSASTGRWTSFASTDDGFEDLSYFPTAPASETLDLDITVPAGAGLRLVENELTLVDGNGTPRARAAPPWISGADGTIAPATTSVLTCAYDASPAPPWGRAIVAPGHSICRVRISWDGASVGGYPLVVDPSWSYSGSLATARSGHSASLLANGRVLVAGGVGTGGALTSAELYDPTTATWAATGSMVNARASHSATLLTSGTEVLVAGGDNGAVTTATAEIYSQANGTWSVTGSMSTGRDYDQAFALDTTHVLVAGGVSFGATGPETTLGTTEVYNRTAGTWSAVGSLSQPRAFAVGIIAGGLAVPLLAGGDNGTAALTTFDNYVPLTQTWAATPGMLHVHENATAVAYGSWNNLFIAGGTDFAGNALTACEEYNFSLGVWSTGLNLGTARGILAGAANGTKFTMIGGGNAATASLASTEIFDETANTISAGPNLNKARWGHTATTLGTGHILVAGGLDASTNLPLASTELL